MKFRKKPVVIDAIQYNNLIGDYQAVKQWMEDQEPGSSENMEWDSPSLVIRTLEGNMIASPRDYIIRGVNGEYYPCKPDIFEKTYDAVEEVAVEP